MFIKEWSEGMESVMYNTLLELPLFQGLGRNDVTDIIEKVKLHFTKLKTGETIANQGCNTNKLIFLLNGEIVSERKDEKGGFLWYETFKAPMVIEPYSLFGMHPCYTQSYMAATDVGLVCIDKAYILDILNKYEIFRINFLNILSNRGQYFQKRLQNARGTNLKERIIHFFINQSELPYGKKTIKISMEDLAKMMNETRLAVSHVLNDMQQNNLLKLQRKVIIIDDLRMLTDAINNN